MQFSRHLSLLTWISVVGSPEQFRSARRIELLLLLALAVPDENRFPLFLLLQRLARDHLIRARRHSGFNLQPVTIGPLLPQPRDRAFQLRQAASCKTTVSSRANV